MNWSHEFVELDKTIHDRISFDCGEPIINDFLQTKAAKHMKLGLSKTMVLPASTPGLSSAILFCSQSGGLKM